MNIMFRTAVLSILFLFLFKYPVYSQNIDATRKLALELAGEKNHPAAAIEYRRLALMEKTPEKRAGYFWAAAHQYWQNDNYQLTQKMLDNAENADPEILNSALLLRAEAALSANKETEAAFYSKSILNSTDSPINYKRTAARQYARAMLIKKGRLEDKSLLKNEHTDDRRLLADIYNYEHGRDKSPRLGGILGLIPGLGYAYAGEYANAVRSLLLNSIFIFGMVETAENEHWGSFAAITFFELTWYTGSIYGGIDATHRYNKGRLNQCITPLEESGRFSPDSSSVPIISLKFGF